MSRADSQHRKTKVFVPDTSVLINLLATPIADRVIEAVGSDWVYTDLVYRELITPAAHGSKNAEGIARLCEQGLLKPVQMSQDAERVAVSLMSGSAVASIGEGEAATIAFAVTRPDAVAIIDDGKATRVGRTRFSQLQITTTMGIMREPAVEARIGRTALADSVEAAIRDARAAVATDEFRWVLDLVGRERLATCPSVARYLRSK